MWSLTSSMRLQHRHITIPGYVGISWIRRMHYSLLGLAMTLSPLNLISISHNLADSLPKSYYRKNAWFTPTLTTLGYRMEFT